MFGRLSRQLLVVTCPKSWQYQSRWFNVHEYTAMTLLLRNGILVPDFSLASTANEVYDLARKFEQRTGQPQVMLKAQVLAGGRSRGVWSSGLEGGGVRLAADADDARRLAAGMLGHRLRTRQTGPDGRPCHRLLVCEPARPVREFYLAVAMATVAGDRNNGGECGGGGPTLMAARLGGVGIEEAAAGAVAAIPLGPDADLSEAAAAEVAERQLGLSGSAAEAAADCARRLCRLFSETDATLLEVNPVAVDSEGRVICLDCKLNVDSNADYRQHELSAARDPAQEDPRDVAAAKFGLKFVAMEGDIGCLVNGAGLAMATMDIVQLHGGRPANFLDVGGAVTAEQVARAVEMLGSDGRVSAVLVNIFGGIVRCDLVAEGLLAGVRRLRPSGARPQHPPPVVVRLRGSRADAAEELLRREAGGDDGRVRVCEGGMDEAAELVVQLAAKASPLESRG